MTDLSAFGGGIDEPNSDEEAQPATTTSRSYPNGRCPGITTDGTRCRANASRMGDDGLCGVHRRQHDPVTIHDGPKRLIEATSRQLWRKCEFEHDRQRRLLHRLVGLEDEPLRASEDGLWLPERFRAADRLIIRAPTATVDSYIPSDNVRDPVFGSVRAGHWDPDYLDGVGRTAQLRNEECLPTEDRPPRVGLLIEGGRQWWFPIERQERDPDGSTGNAVSES